MTLSSQVAFAKFPDVPTNFHQYEAITWLEEYGVIQGYPDGTYQPEKPVNRAEFLKMLYKTLEVDVNNMAAGGDFYGKFPDVKEGDWFWPYVRYAYLNNTVQGYKDGYFKPGNDISMAEAIKVVIEEFFDPEDLEIVDPRYCNYDDETWGSAVLIELGVDTSAWYWKYLNQASSLCLLSNGYNANGIVGLLVDSYFDRGDMAELLYRARRIIDGGSSHYDGPFRWGSKEVEKS